MRHEQTVWTHLAFSIRSALILLIMTGFKAPSAALDWEIEYADCSRLFTDKSDRSIRMDSDGHPHLVYGGRRLYYARFDGIDWHREVVDRSHSVGRYASLDLDSNNEPHISYYDEAQQDLRYAYKDRLGWHIECIDTTGNVGIFTSLSLDDNGRAHISYSRPDGHPDGLRYAVKTVTGWEIEIIAESGGNTSLALDTDGYPHIARDGLYAFKDVAGWHLESAPGGDGTMALDGNRFPHMCYSYCDYIPPDQVDDGANYVYKDSSGWHEEYLDSDPIRGTSIAIDSDGYAHLTYSGSRLWYAYRDDSGWHRTLVAEETGGVSHTSLVLDDQGIPHIGYYGVHHSEIRYATRTEHGFEIHAIDRGGVVGTHNSLAVDSDGAPHISHYDESHDEVEYTYRLTSGSTTYWHKETVCNAGAHGGHTSLAIDSSGSPHVSFHGRLAGDSGHRKLQYAARGDSGWSTETVDDVGWGTGTYNSLVVDRSDVPHISYYGRSPAGPLKYAYKGPSGWQTEVVEERVESERGPTSLVIDGQGNPHISYPYYDFGYPSTYSMNYAHKDETGWSIEIVDDSARCTGTSLVLDTMNRPHIGYSVHYYEIPRYAFRDGEGWHIEEVDTSLANGGSFVSLTLCSNEVPCISYLDIASGDLRFAYRTESGWQVETVDSEGDVGTFNSLVSDEFGKIHISYFNETKGNLKYATAWEPLGSDPVPVAAPMATLRHLGPSPSRDRVAVALYVPCPDNVAVRVIDLAGRRVQMVYEGILPMGEHRFVWDGCNGTGRNAGNGVYFCMGRVGDQRVSLPIVLLR